MKSIRPIKRFGQNYLADKNILAKIINEISPDKDDILLEVGPGTGVLTRELLPKVSKLIGVEIDKRVVENLMAENPGLELINNDFLKVNLEEIHNKYNRRLRIAGNIPYNITSPIIFTLIKNHRFFSDAVFMIQHEVAKRLTAHSRTKEYGILSVILKYFAEVKFCLKVSPGSFVPRPKVDSAIIHIFFKEQEQNPEYEKLFISVVKAAFGNRRKILRNSLNNSIFGKLDMTESPVDLSKRAEELELSDFLNLTGFIYGEMNG